MKARGTVAQPVVDLRKEPWDAPAAQRRDDGRQSQLLYNEKLLVIDEEGEWLRVEATEQPKFLGPSGWGGYPGWVRKRAVSLMEKPPGRDVSIIGACAAVAAGPSPDARVLFSLSFGSRLTAVGEERGFLEIPLPDGKAGWVSKKEAAVPGTEGLQGRSIGSELARLARLFLGVPYLWGGRSMPLPGSATLPGVDCSGLVSLLFRALGRDVPRDARDQWLASRPIGAHELRPGDLIFLARERKPEAIDHVLLWLGGEQYIEAPHTGEVVRIRSFSDKAGCHVERLETENFTMEGKKLLFGRIEG